LQKPDLKKASRPLVFAGISSLSCQIIGELAAKKNNNCFV